MHLGDHNINCGAKKDMSEDSCKKMRQEMNRAFDSGDITSITRLMDKYFEKSTYSLTHLFKDEQRKVLGQVLRLTIEDVEVSFKNIYENNYSIMNFLLDSKIPLPRPLFIATEYFINSNLKACFEPESVDTREIESLIQEAKKWSVNIDKDTLGFVASKRIVSLMSELNKAPRNTEIMKKIINILELLKPLSIPLRLWKAQNICLFVEKELFAKLESLSNNNDRQAQEWVKTFRKLSEELNVKV